MVFENSANTGLSFADIVFFVSREGSHWTMELSPTQSTDGNGFCVSQRIPETRSMAKEPVETNSRFSFVIVRVCLKFPTVSGLSVRTFIDWSIAGFDSAESGFL